MSKMKSNEEQIRDNIIDQLIDGRSFIAISINSDGSYRENRFKVSPEEAFAMTSKLAQAILVNEIG